MIFTLTLFIGHARFQLVDLLVVALRLVDREVYNV